MNDTNSSFSTLVDAVGGPDMFIWVVMFSILIIVAVVLYFLGPKEEA